MVIDRKKMIRVCCAGMLSLAGASVSTAAENQPSWGGLLAGLGPAPASNETPAPNATVAPDGKIIPINAPPRDVQRLGAAPAATAPCPDAKPLAAADAMTLVRSVATSEDFYPDFVVSVAKIESHYDATALSDKGAYGLMQLTPDTAAFYKVNICDPADNVRGGVRFLRELHGRYKNPIFMLAAYNAGEKAMITSRGLPPYPETLAFVANVLNDFYAWPALPRTASADKLAGKATGASAGDELIQQPDSKPHAAGGPEWTDGFVMHVDD